MKKVVVVGSINMDFTIETERMPKIGETISGGNFVNAFGGKGLNQAIALSRQGASVTFIGAVGNDSNGKLCLDYLKENGVDYKGEILDNVSTGAAVITVCGGNNSIILNGGANMALTPEMIKRRESLFEEACMVVAQLEVPVETVVEAFKAAKRKNCLCVLNPAPAKKMPDELLSLTDIIVPNETEAEIITGISCDCEENFKRCSDKLCEMGVKSPIITLGEKGSMIKLDGEYYFQKSYPVKAVDTTAAGDSFIGSMCAMLAEGKSIKEAMDYGARVSSVTVSTRGAAESIPYKL